MVAQAATQSTAGTSSTSSTASVSVSTTIVYSSTSWTTIYDCNATVISTIWTGNAPTTTEYTGTAPTTIVYTGNPPTTVWVGTTTTESISYPSATTVTQNSTLSQTSSTKKPSASHNSSCAAPYYVKASDHHLDDGAAAGLVIGTCIGIALITFAFAYLFFRRRNPRHTRDEPIPLNFKQGSHSGTGARWEPYFRQNLDRQAIHHKVGTLFDQIELHVENFYLEKPSSGPDISSLNLSGFGTKYLPQSLGVLMKTARRRRAIIKHCLVYDIVSRIATDGDPETSLMPMDMITLPFKSRASGNDSQRRLEVQEAATSYWRVLTTYLRYPPQSDQAYLEHRDLIIDRAAETFCRTFGSWANTSHQADERFRHLASVYKAASGLGLELFGQSAEFAFEWNALTEDRNRTRNTVVVRPAMLMIRDEANTQLSTPILLVEQKNSSY